MWQNWKPWTNTENNINFYNYTLSSVENESKLKLLATRFKCEKITYTSSGHSFVMLNYAGLQNNVNNYWLSFINGIWTFYYSNDIKTVKFKDSSDSKIITINLDNYTVSTTYSLGFDITCGLETNTNLKYITIQASEDSSVNGNGGYSWLLYCYELGLEDNYEPYYWDNKDWTPNQLKFSSIVKYNNILTEDKNDRGSAVLLPEISNSTGASNYEQDENGYCYIKDNEGNIVYNKFLNTLARKTKINNGYRINGNQSLELLSFNNNIYDYDKQSGQYLFSGNKKQTYGNKENTNQTIQKQNVPYFGGQPAIYPILVYSNMLSNSEDVIVIKNDTNITINDKSYAYNKENDIIIYYIRNAYQPEDITYQTEITNYSKKEEWRFKFLGTNPFRSGDMSCQLTDQSTSIVFPSEKKLSIWCAELTNNLGIVQNTRLEDPNNLTSIQKEYFNKIIEYTDIDFYIGSSLQYQEDWFYFNNTLYFTLGSFSGGGLNPAFISCRGNAYQIPYIGLQSKNYYTAFDSSVSCTPDYNKTYGTFRIPININYKHIPGFFPSTIGFFTESSDTGEKNISLGEESGKRTWNIQTSPNRTSFKLNYTTYEDTQFVFDYKDVFLNDSNVPTSIGMEILGYIEFNNNSSQQAIAVVIWKNGKLLENS